MGRKALITDSIYLSVKRIIEKRGPKNRLTAGVVLGELRLLKKQGSLPDAPLPGESAIRKLMQEIKSQEPSPRDLPWSIGVSVEYGIEADIIPIIIKIQTNVREFSLTDPGYEKRLFESLKEYSQATGGVYLGGEAAITIRDAQWLSKIYPLLQVIAREKDEIADYWKIPNNDDSLKLAISFAYTIAKVYSRLEQAHEVLRKGSPFDTRKLDDYFFISKKYFDLNYIARRELAFWVALDMDTKYFDWAEKYYNRKGEKENERTYSKKAVQKQKGRAGRKSQLVSNS